MLGLALNIAFAAAMWWTWKDFRMTRELRGVENGTDDRVTIYKVYKMNVPRKFRRLLRHAMSSRQRFKDEDDEDLTVDGPLDVTLPLKDRSQECIRIIVQCEG